MAREDRWLELAKEANKTLPVGLAVAVVQATAIDYLADAVRLIAHGPASGATGLEALGMAIAGEGRGRPLGETIDRAADEIAAAVKELSEAIASRGEP